MSKERVWQWTDIISHHYAACLIMSGVQDSHSEALVQLPVPEPVNCGKYNVFCGFGFPR